MYFLSLLVGLEPGTSLWSSTVQHRRNRTETPHTKPSRYTPPPLPAHRTSLTLVAYLGASPYSHGLVLRLHLLVGDAFLGFLSCIWSVQHSLPQPLADILTGISLNHAFAGSSAKTTIKRKRTRRVSPSRFVPPTSRCQRDDRESS